MTLAALARRPVHLVTIAAIFVATLAVGVLQPGALDDLRNAVFDTQQRTHAANADADSPVRVVAIDEASLAARGQWPWPRTLVADLSERLTRAGAAAIAFDVVFAEPDRSSLEHIVPTLPDGEEKATLARLAASRPSHDARFAEALANGPTVLGLTFRTDPPAAGTPPHAIAAKAGFATAGDPAEPHLPLYADLAVPLPLLATAAHGLGATNWLPEHDQIVRRIPLVARTSATMMPSLALEALRVAQGAPSVLIRATGAAGQTGFGHGGINAMRVGDLTVDTDVNGAVRPRYRRTAPAAWISADAVLADRLAPDAVDGRIVFVGTTAVGLGDIRATPLDASVPGVEMHAQVVEGLLSGHLLTRPDWAAGAETFAALALVLIVGALLPGLPPFAAAALGATLVGALAGLSLAAFRYDVLIDPAFPALALIATHLFGALAVWRSEQMTRRTIHAAFGKFLSPAVVDRLAENPERLVLGGETRDLTVMFSDLRNFTTLSEGLDAAELTAFMNDYLTPMTDAVLETHGTVDKYIGDAMVAFWNAPLDDPDHTAHAVAAALHMRHALVEFRARRAAVDARAGRPPRDIRMGLGLARGPCSVGNMGSIRRFDYSILGDTANLASRLEGVSKIYGVDIVASDEVRAATPDLAWLELDRVRVKGREAATTLFTLVGNADFARSAVFAAWATRHRDFRDHWTAARFGEALAEAHALAAGVGPDWHRCYEIFAARIEALIARPPGPDWSPIRRLDEK